MAIIRFFAGIVVIAGIFTFSAELQWRGLNYILFQVKKAAFSKIAKGFDSLEELSYGLTGNRLEHIYGD